MEGKEITKAKARGWRNAKSQTQNSVQKILFIRGDNCRANDKRLFYPFSFNIWAGCQRLDCRVSFYGQGTAPVFRLLHTHIQLSWQIEPQLLFSVFFTSWYCTEDNREQDRTILVRLMHLNESVTGLSFLTTELPLKSKDQFLIILFIFPESISLAQTFHRSSCQSLWISDKVQSLNSLDYGHHPLGEIPFCSFLPIWPLCNSAYSATHSLLYLLKNISFPAPVEPVYGYSKEKSQEL